MILGVHHAALAVTDLEAALAFYCGSLGFEVVMEAQIPSGIDVIGKAMDIEDSGFKVRMIQKGTSRIELFEFNSAIEGETNRPVNRVGITHIGLVSNDIAVDYDQLIEAGVTFNAKLLGAAPTRFAYGRDPFGNVIELMEDEAYSA